MNILSHRVSRASLISEEYGLSGHEVIDAMLAGKLPSDEEFQVEVTGDLLRAEVQAGIEDAVAWGDPEPEFDDLLADFATYFGIPLEWAKEQVAGVTA